MSKRNSPEDVFAYIDTHGNDPDVCWEWTGYVNPLNKRGMMSINGTRKLAYHIVFELFHGPIPDGQVVRHTCDTPICNNPTHLVLGTHGNNEEDKYERNRWGYTDDMVLEMRRLHRLGMSLRRIAYEINKKFECDVSFAGVRKVVNNETVSARKMQRLEDEQQRQQTKPRGSRKQETDH